MGNSQYRRTLLANLYRITSLKLRRAEHLGLIMYRLSADDHYIEQSRPNIILWSNNKVKDRQQERTTVSSRSHLNALCTFATPAIHKYYI